MHDMRDNLILANRRGGGNYNVNKTGQHVEIREGMGYRGGGRRLGSWRWQWRSDQVARSSGEVDAAEGYRNIQSGDTLM